MKLEEILSSYSDAAIDQLSSDKLNESASLRLPRNVIQQEIISALTSLSYVGGFLTSSRPPTYVILKVLIDVDGHKLSVDSFQESVFALIKEFSDVAETGRGLTRRKDYGLYKRMLLAAWSSDGNVDSSEGRLLQVLREELGIWTREHLLLEYHPDVQKMWNKDKGYVEARNLLLSTGIVLSYANQFVLADEVVLQIRRAWDIDIDDFDYKRLLDALTNERLYSLSQDLGVMLTGNKDEKIDTIIKAFVPPKELLSLLTTKELGTICSAVGARVSGSKTDRIDNLIDYFDEQRDLAPEKEKFKEAGPPREAQPREMDPEDFRYVLEQLTGNQLYDLLTECFLKVSGTNVGDNRNEDDSDNGVLGIGCKWTHRGIEYPCPGRRDAFS